MVTIAPLAALPELELLDCAEDLLNGQRQDVFLAIPLAPARNHACDHDIKQVPYPMPTRMNELLRLFSRLDARTRKLYKTLSSKRAQPQKPLWMRPGVVFFRTRQPDLWRQALGSVSPTLWRQRGQDSFEAVSFALPPLIGEPAAHLATPQALLPPRRDLAELGGLSRRSDGRPSPIESLVARIFSARRARERSPSFETSEQLAAAVAALGHPGRKRPEPNEDEEQSAENPAALSGDELVDTASESSGEGPRRLPDRARGLGSAAVVCRRFVRERPRYTRYARGIVTPALGGRVEVPLEQAMCLSEDLPASHPRALEALRRGPLRHPGAVSLVLRDQGRLFLRTVKDPQERLDGLAPAELWRRLGELCWAELRCGGVTLTLDDGEAEVSARYQAAGRRASLVRWRHRLGVHDIRDLREADDMLRQSALSIAAHVVTGSRVMLYRSPITAVASLGVREIQVVPGARVIGLPLILTPSLQADYDGDEVNLVTLDSAGARIAAEAHLSPGVTAFRCDGSPVLAPLWDGRCGLELICRGGYNVDMTDQDRAELLRRLPHASPELVSLARELTTWQDAITLAVLALPANSDGLRVAPSFFSGGRQTLQAGQYLGGPVDARGARTWQRAVALVEGDAAGAAVMSANLHEAGVCYLNRLGGHSRFLLSDVAATGWLGRRLRRICGVGAGMRVRPLDPGPAPHAAVLLDRKRAAQQQIARDVFDAVVAWQLMDALEQALALRLMRSASHALRRAAGSYEEADLRLRRYAACMARLEALCQVDRRIDVDSPAICKLPFVKASRDAIRSFLGVPCAALPPKGRLHHSDNPDEQFSGVFLEDGMLGRVSRRAQDVLELRAYLGTRPTGPLENAGVLRKRAVLLACEHASQALPFGHIRDPTTGRILLAAGQAPLALSLMPVATTPLLSKPQLRQPPTRLRFEPQGPPAPGLAAQGWLVDVVEALLQLPAQPQPAQPAPRAQRVSEPELLRLTCALRPVALCLREGRSLPGRLAVDEASAWTRVWLRDEPPDTEAVMVLERGLRRCGACGVDTPQRRVLNDRGELATLWECELCRQRPGERAARGGRALYSHRARLLHLMARPKLAAGFIRIELCGEELVDACFSEMHRGDLERRLASACEGGSCRLLGWQERGLVRGQVVVAHLYATDQEELGYAFEALQAGLGRQVWRSASGPRTGSTGLGSLPFGVSVAEVERDYRTACAHFGVSGAQASIARDMTGSPAAVLLAALMCRDGQPKSIAESDDPPFEKFLATGSLRHLMADSEPEGHPRHETRRLLGLREPGARPRKVWHRALDQPRKRAKQERRALGE